MKRRVVRVVPGGIIDVLGTKDLARYVSAGKKQGYRVTTKKVGKDGRYNAYIVEYWSRKAG